MSIRNVITGAGEAVFNLSWRSAVLDYPNEHTARVRTVKEVRMLDGSRASYEKAQEPGARVVVIFGNDEAQVFDANDRVLTFHETRFGDDYSG